MLNTRKSGYGQLTNLGVHFSDIAKADGNEKKK